MFGSFRDRKELRGLKEARLPVDVKAAVSIAVTDIQPIVVRTSQKECFRGNNDPTKCNPKIIQTRISEGNL
jgi:hypothetical protein